MVGNSCVYFFFTNVYISVLLKDVNFRVVLTTGSTTAVRRNLDFPYVKAKPVAAVLMGHGAVILEILAEFLLLFLHLSSLLSTGVLNGDN